MYIQSQKNVSMVLEKLNKNKTINAFLSETLLNPQSKGLPLSVAIVVVVECRVI